MSLNNIKFSLIMVKYLKKTFLPFLFVDKIYMFTKIMKI